MCIDNEINFNPQALDAWAYADLRLLCGNDKWWSSQLAFQVVMTPLSEFLVLCKIEWTWARHVSPPWSRPCLLLQLIAGVSSFAFIDLAIITGMSFKFLEESVCLSLCWKSHSPSSFHCTGLFSPGESSFLIEYVALC